MRPFQACPVVQVDPGMAIARFASLRWCLASLVLRRWCFAWMCKYTVCGVNYGKCHSERMNVIGGGLADCCIAWCTGWNTGQSTGGLGRWAMDPRILQRLDHSQWVSYSECPQRALDRIRHEVLHDCNGNANKDRKMRPGTSIVRLRFSCNISVQLWLQFATVIKIEKALTLSSTWLFYTSLWTKIFTIPHDLQWSHSTAPEGPYLYYLPPECRSHPSPTGQGLLRNQSKSEAWCWRTFRRPVL